MIKVGYLISYDYEFLFTSLKGIYDHVDEIFLAIDQDYKTWSGNSFDIPENFFREIELFDTRKIINIYRDRFYIPGLAAIECDTRERNMLLKKMGRGWLIQLDVDEYIYDFSKVTEYLRKYWYLTLFPKLTPITFQGKWITLFKRVEGGYLIIDSDEHFSFITNQHSYTYIRNTKGAFNHFTNIIAIHQSWARDEMEVKTKITNWGHKDDFDTAEYFLDWKKLSKQNHKEYQNFHPISGKIWKRLSFIPSDSIDELLREISIKRPQVLFEPDIKNVFKVHIRKIWSKVRSTLVVSKEQQYNKK